MLQEFIKTKIEDQSEADLITPHTKFNFTTESLEKFIKDYEEFRVNKIKSMKPKVADYDLIEKCVCEHKKIHRSMIQNKTRKREVVIARQYVHFLTRKYIPKLSLARIGLLAGHKDHATVKYSIGEVTNFLESDKDVQKDIAIIEDMIKAGLVPDEVKEQAELEEIQKSLEPQDEEPKPKLPKLPKPAFIEENFPITHTGIGINIPPDSKFLCHARL